ncbi:hypothetical protein MHYP_G00147270 [Metynnis hypsauchen]
MVRKELVKLRQGGITGPEAAQIDWSWTLEWDDHLLACSLFRGSLHGAVLPPKTPPYCSAVDAADLEQN